MAVTRDGIPVRVWCWPGNTADSALIRQVKDDMRTEPCRGSSVSPTAASPPRRTACARAGITTHRKKLRSGSAEAAAALSQQGRYQHVAANLKVKEVRIAEYERFTICFNIEGNERDAAVDYSVYEAYAKPSEAAPLTACLRRSESFLIIFMGSFA
jgi:hypothetical protein